MSRSSIQKINKENLALNNTLDQMNLIDINRENILPKNRRIQQLLFKHTWNILQKGYMLSHKTSLNKFKKTEIISNIFFKPQGCETKNQLQGEKWKNHRQVEANNMLLNNQSSQKKSKRKF